MRQMLVGLALAMSLVAVFGTSGCAAASPQTEAQIDEFAAYVAELQDMQGVAQVDLNANDLTSSASLTVQIEPDVERESLAAIGAKISTFTATAQDYGFVPSDPVVRLDESTYSYFDGVMSEEVGDQLNYWLELQRTGVDAVQMRVFTPTSSVPAHGMLGVDDLLQEEMEQSPRYVLVELPANVSETELRSLIDALAAVKDPGASGGQWDFLNLAPRTKGEFTEPQFPSVPELSYAVTAGNHFANVNGLANVEVLRDSGHDTPLRIRIAVFDDVMDGVTSTNAEYMFTKTDAWPYLLELVSLLESTGTIDYGVQVLANPLDDGGNFQLKFGVHGCEFQADQNWPTLSADLTSVWEENASTERFESDPTCDSPKNHHADVHGDHEGDEPEESDEP